MFLGKKVSELPKEIYGGRVCFSRTIVPSPLNNPPGAGLGIAGVACESPRRKFGIIFH
jgi:hypothetical protein